MRVCLMIEGQEVMTSCFLGTDRCEVLDRIGCFALIGERLLPAVA
jgi:hypothetical protein